MSNGPGRDFCHARYTNARQSVDCRSALCLFQTIVIAESLDGFFSQEVGAVSNHQASGGCIRSGSKPVVCFGFRDRFSKESERLVPMPEKIRLACRNCDTEECDGIEEIPADWVEVQFVQTLEASQQEVALNDDSRSVTEWYTHLGLCPDCQTAEQ